MSVSGLGVFIHVPACHPYHIMKLWAAMSVKRYNIVIMTLSRSHISTFFKIQNILNNDELRRKLKNVGNNALTFKENVIVSYYQVSCH